MLGVEPGSTQELKALNLLEELGAKRLVRSLKSSLDTKVSSAELSLSERRTVSCVRGIMAEAPLVLFDDPTTDLGRGASERRVRSVLDACKGRTVLATFSRHPPQGLFDRVIVLRNAKIIEDSESSLLTAESQEDMFEVKKI